MEVRLLAVSPKSFSLFFALTLADPRVPIDDLRFFCFLWILFREVSVFPTSDMGWIAVALAHQIPFFHWL